MKDRWLAVSWSEAAPVDSSCLDDGSQQLYPSYVLLQRYLGV